MITFRYKIAALTEAEQAEFKQVIRNHADFDQKAGLGDMSAEMKEAMRHNVDRIKAYRAKKADDFATIPAWARNPTGKPPAGGSTRGPRPSGNANRPRPGGSTYDWGERAHHQRHSWDDYDAAATRARNERQARWAREDAAAARRNAVRYTTVAREAEHTSHSNSVAAAIGLGLLAAPIAYAYHAKKSQKVKIKDTERSDKGKTHKKNYTYHAPDMKKAASY